MKNILFTFVLVIGGFLASANAQFNIGIGLAAPLNDFQLGVQGRVMYTFTDLIRGNGTFNYFLGSPRNVSIEADAQFTLLETESFSLAPLVGLNFTTIEGANLNSAFQIGLFTEIGWDGPDLYIEPKMVIDSEQSYVLSIGLLF